MGSEWHELGTAISSPTYEREGEVKYIGAAVRLVPCQSFYIYIYKVTVRDTASFFNGYFREGWREREERERERVERERESGERERGRERR